MDLLALNSGGIDSPVAMDIMLQHGHAVDAITFDNAPFALDDGLDTVRETMQALADRHDTELELTVVPHGTYQQAFLDEVDEDALKYSCLFKRRSMLRIASGQGVDGLVTGDSIAQVASQTIDNLRLLSDAASVPVFRPVLCWDKTEIVDHARRIGTYDITKGGGIECAVNPDHPETHGSVAAIKEVETDFDLEELRETVMADAETETFAP